MELIDIRAVLGVVLILGGVSGDDTALASGPEPENLSMTATSYQIAQKLVQKKVSSGRTLLVGPNRKYKKPSAVTKIVRPGDRILIDAGKYEDCAVWKTKNLRFEGVGGYAHIDQKTCEDKALWVFYAGPVEMKHIRFSRAHVINRNGAGIRWEGNSRLTVRESWFDHNQMGILTHNKKKSQLVVTKSKFELNGNCDSFCGHGIYAGFISHLLVQASVFEGHMYGHHIKSRAYHSQIVGNKFIDGQNGNSSFSIDLPNSGTGIIRYNFLQKGAKANNVKCLICIGEEIRGPKMWSVDPATRRNPSRGILIEHNTFQNDHKRRTIFVWNRGLDKVVMRSNRYTGPGQPYRGVAKTRSPVRSR